MSETNGNGRLLGKDILKEAAHSSALTGLSRIANLAAPFLLSALLYMGQSIMSQQQEARKQTEADVKEVRSTVIELQGKYNQTNQQVISIQTKLDSDSTIASARTETRRTEAVQTSGQLADLKARLEGIGHNLEELTRRLDAYPIPHGGSK